jgi:choline dehydrogenase-like flavoprotein
MKAHVAVIGGGMAGLELATTLAARGTVQVEVIERGPATRKDHVLWDRGSYPGDKKTRRWVGEGWGPRGGLSERLGGRSLCYHGVFLGIEARALTAWPTAWINRLEGYYRSVPQELEESFPELRPTSPATEIHGLRHVPQAVKLSDDGRLLKAYTPLTQAIALAEAGTLEIVRAAAVRVRPGHGRSWIVDVTDPDGTPRERGPFDACVLASSAIGNVQLLSRSLDREIETNLTDHLSIGSLVRLPASRSLTEFRNRNLWVGYIPVPELEANIFVGEEPGRNGDRILHIHAVMEQDPSDEGSSTLLALPRSQPEAHITPTLSEADEAKLVKLRHRMRDIAGLLGQESIHSPTESPGTLAQARETNTDLAPKSVSDYRLPYGEYDHESSTHPIGGKAIEISPDLEVEELPGIHVAGPGAFPRIGAANPALTILAMSRSLAAILHDRYS